MKCIFIILAFVSIRTCGQINSLNTVNGAITITPQGFKGSTNSASLNTTYVSLGNNALKSNTTGAGNVAIGADVLRENLDGTGNTAIGWESLRYNKNGYFNTAIGYEALWLNTDGSDNTASGAGSLKYNKTGRGSTATGVEALYYNTTGSYNAAHGNGALRSNLTGNYNSATGFWALFSNSSGHNNSAHGNAALVNNISGSNNTATGVSSLTINSTGSYNTASGYFSGQGNVSGSYNTFLGYNTVISLGDLTNATAIGANAQVNASNKVRIGDVNVTVIEGAVPWSTPSDRSLKQNIKYTSRLGLNFITKLKPASYYYTADKSKLRHDGFIAQDVEKVMRDLGVEFSGLQRSPDGTYSLAYSDFVMPLVNAVKEQQKQIEDLKKEVAALKELKKQVEALVKAGALK
ncbi:hypothetical protein DR864_00470 [Runella rosea]|uniref:Peptidase S74 domain-containing protein n=1 Tax=Runella rosea TaxID=2259595 RepID=A0A344TCD6_9BACT|nr:tail fiber domain-containing protein [Runella rosea]AXE16252.1 hypothetical protein DR864_00195 [Runella rosea]AXE16307.1 hypothetical protein DR864_00470 [Runella rosea]